MKANEYRLLEECVANGITLGLSRAHKHTDTPTTGQIETQLHMTIMNEICEWFKFEDGYDD